MTNAGKRPSQGDCSGNEIIGYSREGRPLIAHHCGNASGLVRILVMAGQHGDEVDAPIAALEFLRMVRSGAVSPKASFAVVADANPDGAAAGTRLNANGADLNRDHLILAEPETRAVHSFVARWQPDLIIDVHMYRPRRKELLEHDLIFSQDVMFDFPTNPAARLGMSPHSAARLLKYLKAKLAAASIRCDRYTLVRPSGIIRHSNTDILDARNALSLRYGVFSVLLEGRRPSSEDPPGFAPAKFAIARSLEFLVAWAVADTKRIKRSETTFKSVPVSCRYFGAGRPLVMEMLSATERDVRKIGIPGHYSADVITTMQIRPPKAYAVPRKLDKILEVLERHRFRRTASPKGRSTGVAYRIVRLSGKDAKGRATTLACSRDSVEFDPHKFVLFPAKQPGGTALAVLLEPGSKFGLHRFPSLGLTMKVGMRYPIIRALSQTQKARKPK